MNNLIKCLGVAACCFLFGGLSQAQAQVKIGYLNTSELISLMPETKAADSQFNAFAQKLQETLQPMQKDLQSKFEAYQKEQATLADAVKQSREQEMQDLNQRVTQSAEQIFTGIEVQQAAFLKGIFLVKQAFYCLFDIYLINTCQKAQPSQINTQHRQSRIPDQSYRIKQSPVTSQAQQKLRITRQILMRIKRCAPVRPVNLLIAKKVAKGLIDTDRGPVAFQNTKHLLYIRERLVREKGRIGPQLQADLDRLGDAGIPVDVIFEQGVEVLGL